MVKKQLTLIVFTLLAITSYAQVKISGTVYDEYLEPFYSAKISQGKNYEISNTSGEFSLILEGKLPTSITVTAFGYKTEEIEITSLDQEINVILKENLLLDQVIISASRVPERIIESPVTVERLGLSEIKRNSANSFYDGLANLKGIDVRESSYGFKTVNTRGFADFANSRFVQLVDGIDTAAPALNYSPGNLSGVSELDILSVEVLPGASSALYGANAYNGILLMNTKSPFDYTGISTSFKTGVTHQLAAGTNPYYDVSTRMAYKFSDAFAAKVNFSYFEAEEWHANDTRNRLIDTQEIAPEPSGVSYDGVNVYGDELYSQIVETDFFPNEDRTFLLNRLLRRKGYLESDLIDDFKTHNLKFSGSLYFRPFKDESLEVELTSRLAIGDNMIQGNSRLAQRGYYLGQHKLEFKGNNFFLRGYFTENDAGKTYDLERTGNLLKIARSANSSGNSYKYDFLYGYFNSPEVNHEGRVNDAYSYVEGFSLKPGTPLFNENLDKITNTLITEGGSTIYDRSSYIHADGNYNFKSLLNNWADVQIGGSYRKYSPNSRGTIFNDKEEPIRVEEYGFYSQIQKKLFNERLKLTGSVRYDKSKNFTGHYSPRFAVNYALGENKDHILRASYQTGFRNPTIQEQYLRRDGFPLNIIGTVEDNLDRVTYENGIKGSDVINNALLTRFYYEENEDQSSGPYKEKVIKSEYKSIQPESVRSFELGYRSIIRLNNNKNLDLDINGFYSKHDDFVFYQAVTVPMYGKVLGDGELDSEAEDAFSFGDVSDFNIITNSKSQVTSYGASIGMHTKFLKNFDLGLNYNFIDYSLDDKDYNLFTPNFNTAKHTFKVQVGNDKLFKNFGFNINGRWQDRYTWLSPFVRGVVNARWVADAQMNYRIPSFKSRIKIGGTNLFGKEYFVAPGMGQIGQQYYISWIINN
ncbi:TonB-dependent receptor [Tenacibaculum sp. C7A-26P2]|uniref:TonB-dependent receptor n=1 Tax=Tenacibaculum sp. C7A-26P2 TaxID=3447504 RepID=UPI003F8585BB